jgi:replicative DNA helicase
MGRTINPSNKKLDINFDLMSLNLLCTYVLSENRNIRRGQLINVRNLFEMLDMDLYINDTERMKRVEFIKRGLEGRLTYNLRYTEMIFKYINGGIIDSDVMDINNFASLSNSELDWINETVSESLKYSYIYNDVDLMMDICTRFKAAEYRYRGEIVREFEALVKTMSTKFRRSRVEAATEVMFSLREGIFEDCVKDTHEQLTNPANKLKSGMQGLNELLAGGFESGRTYMFFGLQGEGKSMTLLNLAYQIKKHNKNYKPKDPNKRPCIVFLTMENTVKETIERLFNIAATADSIINFTAEQAINLLRTDGELYLTDESPIDIIVKFVPGESQDTSYLYTLTEDLEDEGYEVICMIQDYVKRIKSIYNHNGDIRLELGAIVNEFKTFAAIKDIPVITASQLNRDATKSIDEGRQANKGDLIRLLGRSNIGESMLMLDNIDGAFMIAPEFDQAGNKYMGIQRVKNRYRASSRSHIYQPFVPDNTIKFIEDENCTFPVFRDSMRLDAEQVAAKFNNGGVAKSNYMGNNIMELDNNIKLLHSDDINMFMNSDTVFNSNTVLNYTGLNPYMEQQEPVKQLRKVITKCS